VGLGGRFDATNVIAAPAAAAITSLSLDHREFLGDHLALIAREKAGIIKRCRPVVTGAQAPEALAVLEEVAASHGAPLFRRGREWEIVPANHGLHYTDADGALDLPCPALAGPHQIENAGVAIAALRAAGLALPHAAYGGIAAARWPARLQPLHGDLAAMLGPHFSLFLDGGHNEGAARALAAHVDAWRDRPLYLLVGMKQSKNPAEFLAPLLPRARAIWAVAEPGQHLALPVEAIVTASNGAARRGPDVCGALRAIASEEPGRVLICGSLHLAGEVLRLDGTIPE
jgi:dihydrofolate synthase/folylpolyglutamate synthase